MHDLDHALAAEPRLVLLAFLHDGCEPCRELRPQLHVLAEAAADVCRVVLVDAAVEADVVRRYQVLSFPTLVFLRKGVEVQRVKGGALPGSTLTRLKETTEP